MTSNALNHGQTSRCSSANAGLFRVLNARSIAVVGASNDPMKITGRPIAYMLREGFTGALYPVNPHRSEVQGLRSYASLAEISGPIDLALVGTDANGVEAAVRDGIACGIRAFVVFSSGFAETGQRGVEMQERLTRLAQEHDAVILGPNCLGAISSSSGVIASFSSAIEDSPLVHGAYALVSQSGAMGSYWLDSVNRPGLGFSQWITTGNECSITTAQAIDFLVDDSNTRVIGLYLEDVRDVAPFRRALDNAAAAGKPVICIKAGRSQAGASAAASHTGALAGQDVLFDACLVQHGALRVDSLTEMNDVARLCLSGRHLSGRNLGVVSVSGGAAVMLADAADAAGLQIPSFQEATEAALRQCLPSYATARNPLDVTAALAQIPNLLYDTVHAVAHDPRVDVVVVFLGLLPGLADGFAASLVQAQEETATPIVVVWMGAKPSVEGILGAASIPLYADIPRAIASLSAFAHINELHLATTRRRRGMSYHSGDALAHEASIGLSEWESKQRLVGQTEVRLPASLFIAMSDATSAAASERELPFSYPVVAKLQSRDLPHKSDVGGVILDIRDARALGLALAELPSIAESQGIFAQGVLIEEMVPCDQELVLGLRRDARFGPVLMVGRGGTAVELEPDLVTRLLPLDAEEIQGMLGQLRSAALLSGFRGRQSVDIPRIAAVIQRLCAWFLERSSLLELEINPLIVKGQDLWALDALATVCAAQAEKETFHD